MENFFNEEDLLSALSVLNDQNQDKTEKLLSSNMSEEMKASQLRYEHYIKKHQD